MTGYLFVNCKFKFLQRLNIHQYFVTLISPTTVYPLSGSSFLTGPEFLLAKNKGCKFDVKSAFYIHPKEKMNYQYQ